MRRTAIGKSETSLLGFLAKSIIIVGIAALITLYAMRYWNYQTTRDEFLNGERFGSLHEAEVLARRWQNYYNTIRPHSALGGKPPAPQMLIPCTAGQRITDSGSAIKGKMNGFAALDSQAGIRYDTAMQ